MEIKQWSEWVDIISPDKVTRGSDQELTKLIFYVQSKYWLDHLARSNSRLNPRFNAMLVVSAQYDIGDYCHELYGCISWMYGDGTSGYTNAAVAARHDQCSTDKFLVK